MFPAVRVNKVIRQVLMTLAILGTCIFVWLYIAPSKPAFLQKKCPPVLGKSLASQQEYGDTERPVDCGAIFEATLSELEYASTFKWCRRSDAITDKDYLHLTANCDNFIQHGRYNDYEITKEEKDFPLAFSIIMHENIEQMERLLRVIYRPQNVYCVHLDARASASLHQALHGISGCFSNVIIPKHPIKVEWSEFSVLEAELMCMRELWKQKQWKYFINLTGREYPLKTNLELVQILKAYDGANDIDGSPHKRPIIWTKYVWWNENWRTSRLKSPPPDGFVISKGSTHVAATRGFVDYALHDNRSHDLLEWMRDIRVPDEHFFATLNHNPHLDVPGSYKGDPDLKYFYTRLKIWQSKEETCTGRWFRFICQFGVGDLWRLPKAKQLFVNKFHQEMDPIAFDCVEQWYRNRTKTRSKLDIDFYRNLDFVKNHLKG